MQYTHPDNISNLQLFPGNTFPFLILQDINRIIIYRHIILEALLIYIN